MRIAVLGAMGFLGRNLTQDLISRGHQVTGFVLDPPLVQPSNYSCMSLSEFNGLSISQRPIFDVVINLAARRSTKDYPLSDSEVRQFTYEIPREFVLKTAHSQTLVINTSTYIQNFHGVEGQTVDSYGAAKQQLSEFLSKGSGELALSTLDLFFFTLYGEGDRPSHLVPLLLKAAKNGREISLSPGHQLMNLIYIDDVVRSISSCLTVAKDFSYRKYYVWEGKYFSVRELASTIESVTGAPINGVWGGREYSGHEMLKPWPIPMSQLPGFRGDVGLEEGIRRLWSAL